MLYLPDRLAGGFCVWVKVPLMILTRNQPKNVQNNRVSAPLTVLGGGGGWVESTHADFER